LSRACGARLAGLPDARCPRWCTRGQAERKLSARRPLEGNNRASETDQIASLTNVRFRGQADISNPVFRGTNPTRQLRQKSLNRVGDNSVYFTVLNVAMTEVGLQRRVSCPLFASA
jgi:hypothetical protein